MVNSTILDSGRTDVLRFFDTLTGCFFGYTTYLSTESRILFTMFLIMSYAVHSRTPDLSETVIYQSLRREFHLRAAWAYVGDFAVC